MEQVHIPNKHCSRVQESKTLHEFTGYYLSKLNVRENLEMMRFCFIYVYYMFQFIRSEGCDITLVGKLVSRAG